MKTKHAITEVLATGLICGLIPLQAIGAIWVEECAGGHGDAADTLAGAQEINFTSSLSRINGTISGATDRDIFVINIPDPDDFFILVTTTGNGAGNADTVLALFDPVTGLGALYNDDVDDTNFKSRLSSFDGPDVLTVPGYYYLAIMGGDQQFQGGGANIWNETFEFTAQKVPDGAGADNPLDGYGGPGTDVDTYTIVLSGVTPVPESSFYGIAFAVMGLAVAAIHCRKSRKMIVTPPQIG